MNREIRRYLLGGALTFSGLLIHRMMTLALDLLPIQPILIAEYLFDPSEGEVVVDSGPYQFHGELRQGVDRTNGYLGGALEFDGTDDYVYIGDANHLDVNHYTLIAWVQPYSRGFDNRRIEILEKTDAYWMNIRRDSGLLRCGSLFRFPGMVESQWFYVDSTRTLPLNEWTHTACTFDGTALQIYLNGEPAGYLALPKVEGISTESNQLPLAIGAKIDKDDTRVALFHGLIDELRIFSGALEEEQIQNIMQDSPIQTLEEN